MVTATPAKLMTFNRTTVGLKLAPGDDMAQDPPDAFNRTTVGLKPTTVPLGGRPTHFPFNRTTVGLKPVLMSFSTHTDSMLLIAPQWD